ncbi:poly-gamma-glutamate system protein [candidate division WOR-3 bacterium]|nr:poly-gamma-glutamate system protein [candidate division WOR-3 bacterium]
MRRRHGKVHPWVMVVLALISLAMFYAATRSARTRRARWFEEKRQAAQLAGQALATLRDYRARLQVPVDTVNDPNATGLVGVQYSQLTWGRSDLSDALTTTNPNFAAALVELLRRAGVRRGDRVGVSWDGSYPALNVHVLAALSSLGAEPRIVTAQSAGMWGANHPGLTWLELEAVLRERGTWSYRSALATLGGQDDAGMGLAPEAREYLARVADSLGVELAVPSDLAAAVAQRLEFLGDIRALVSVGLVAADLGDPLVRPPSRVITRPGPRVDSTGTLAALLARRVPVLHLGKPTRVALDFGLPVAPVPLPETGKGRLFFERRQSALLAGLLALVLAALLWLVVRYDVEWYLGDRKGRPEEESV